MNVTCVEEMGRYPDRSHVCWHALGDWQFMEGDDWVPILCGEGICYPIYPVEREPTCPGCIAKLTEPNNEGSQ